MILILTYDDDPTVARAAAMLRDRGVDFVRFDPAQYPAAARLTLRHTAGGLEAVLDVAGRRLALHEVAAVWYRRPGPPTVASRVTDPDVRDYARNEAAEVLHGLWKALADLGRCRFVPAAPIAFTERHLKIHQLSAAHQLGFDIPPTLVTNDPAELIAFVQTHGRCITKPIDTASARVPPLFHRMGRYATVITHRDLGYAHTVRDCPALVQAYVPKRVEIRATVVGDRVFAAEIHSQATRRTRTDWRQYDHRHTPHAVHALPDEVAARCVALCRRHGTCFGALDLILTPDGRYVFLEINLNGQYDWIEQRTGLPITAAVCDLLTTPVTPATRQP